MAKKSYPRVVTPSGTFIYPHLTKPDTKFVKPDGVYKTSFALDAEPAQELIDKIESYRDKWFEEEKKPELKPAVLKKAKPADWYEEEFDDEGNETGRILFKFKLAAVVKTPKKSWSQKPALFDAKAQPLAADIDPWTGSEGKCNLELFPYFMESDKSYGVSLRIKGAQILKLASGSGDGDAEGMGFGEEEGFVAPATSQGFSAEESDEDDGDGKDEEF